MTHITDPSKHTISVRLASTIFDDIAAEIGQLLDVQPSGITQESVWLHLKKIGQKASVDQVRITLDKLTQRGELVDAKNGKNETVWKRARKALPKSVLEQVEELQRFRDAGTAQQTRCMAALVVAVEPRAASSESKAVTASAAAVAPTESAPEAAQCEQEAGAAPTPAEAPPIITVPTLEIAAMTPPVDPPPVQPNQKPILHRARTSTPGALIEQQILEALGQGPHTRKQLMDISGASGTGVDNALKRLNGTVARQSTGAWALSESTASGGAAQISLAAPPGAKPMKPRTSSKASTGEDEIDACLDRFTHRLLPVQDLGRKVAAIDQLITVMPVPIAEILTRIRADFVRLAGG